MPGKAAAPDLSEFLTVKRSGQRLVLDERVFPALSPERADKLRAALHTPAISHYRISEVLRAWGFSVHETSVKNWRQRHCDE